MIIASWNMRGMGSPLKHRYLAKFISDQKVSIAALLETKLNLVNLVSLMRKKFVDWDFVHNLDHCSTGRIVVLWKKDRVSMEVLHASSQLIHCRILCKISSQSFVVSFVYGLHSIVNRRPLWESIISLGSEPSFPWMVLGDFNSIRCPDDKLNGADVTAYEIADFNNCCQVAGLSNLSSIGAAFSWSNGSVSSRIDRALANQQWFDLFQGCFAIVS